MNARSKRMIVSAVAAGVLAFGMSRCLACTADIGTANTEVYIRSIDTGEVVGALQKGQRVIVTGKAKNGYKTVRISDTEYKVYGEYLDIDTGCLDEVKVVAKVGKSRSAEAGKGKKNPVSNLKKAKIKGSPFDGLAFW